MNEKRKNVNHHVGDSSRQSAIIRDHRRSFTTAHCIVGVDWFSYTIPIIHLFSDWPISIRIWVYNQLGFCVVLFLTYYSVECQTKSLSNPCIRFTMPFDFPGCFPMRKIIQNISCIKRQVESYVIVC